MNGTVGISMEIELGWAKHDKGAIDHLSDGRAVETKTLERLLSVCERAGVPISFNVVGHLLLERCDGAHEERPNAATWFEMDPGTDRHAAPEFYAPDLVRRIVESPVDHEICTHTFSHTVCGETTAETVDWELTEARWAHERFGLEWSTAMVPPRHSRPDFETAARHGIDTLRVPYPKRVFEMRKPERLYHNLLAAHPTKRPELVDGMCLTYSSPYLSLAAPHLPHGQLSAHPVFRGLPQTLRGRWHDRYLRQALDTVVNEHTTAHFWSHLWDISNQIQWSHVESFIEQLGREQSAGNVEIVRLGEVRDRVA